MRLFEIQPIKPKTPEQQRIANLQGRVKRSQQAVKSERVQQQQRRARQAISKLGSSNIPQ